MSACAVASTPREGPLDAPAQRDGTVEHLDGPPRDGGTQNDAFVMHDAPNGMDGGNPLFCSDNTQCTDPGTCCFFALCVAGTGVGTSLCFPN